MKRTLVFDTETTGLIENSLIREQHQPRIIEFFGNVVNEKGDVVEELEFFVDPGIPIPPIITKITGINAETLRNAKSFGEHAESVQNMLCSCDSAVAHNFSFDCLMIDNEMKRLGLETKWPETCVCTVEQTEWFNGYRLNLQALHEHLFDEQFESAHRARNDVNALTRCFNELRERGEI
jgi:DNA polymerase-3 subunit epsilon